MFPYFHLFHHRFYSYEIVTVVAVIFFFAYFSTALVKLRMNRSEIALFVFAGAFVQYFGGSVIPFLYLGFYEHKMPWMNIWEKPPGRFFHSVALALIAHIVIYCRLFKWPARKVLDIFASAMIFASAIGRIGCLLHGCCSGGRCDLPWAVTLRIFPGVRVHPTQIYALILEVALGFFLCGFDKRKKYDGQTFWMGVFLYSIYRFVIEFWRINAFFFWGLTHAQVFSVLTLALASYVLTRRGWFTFPKAKKSG